MYVDLRVLHRAFELGVFGHIRRGGIEASLELLEGSRGFLALEEPHHVVFLDELALALVFVDRLDVLPVAGQRPLLLYSDAGGQVVRMLERSGQVTYLRFELVDGRGFGGGGCCEVVGSSTLGRVVWVAARL